MKFDDFNVDEVFNNYSRIMTEKGLDKTASYVVPKSILGDDNYTEIDLSEELRKIAAKESEHSKLYDLVSEDVLSSAHSGGSVKIVDAADGLGVVETDKDQQAKMLEVAQKKAKIAERVLNLSSQLDKEGFVSFAKSLDKAVTNFLGKTAEFGFEFGKPKVEDVSIALKRKEGEFAGKVSDVKQKLNSVLSSGDESAKMTANTLLQSMHSAWLFNAQARKPRVLESLPLDVRKSVVELLVLIRDISELKKHVNSAPQQPKTPVEPGVSKDVQ